MYSLIFVLVICFTNGWAYTIDDCPNELVRDRNLKVFGSTCYRFENGPKESYEDAHKQCFQQGGTLVTVKNTNVNGFLINEINQRSELSKVYIGLKYDRFFGTYYWIDGSPLDSNYDNFTTNGKGHNCVVIQNNHWVSGKCTTKNNFICQFIIETDDVNPSTPEPKYEPISLEDCPSNLKRDSHLKVFEDKCYSFHTQRPLNFHDAIEACDANGGSLAMLKTSQIDQFVVQGLMDEKPLYIWIALRYFPLLSTFNWKDGSPMTYSNIRTKVFNSKYDCVGLNPNDGLWEVRSCVKHYGYVCEYGGQQGSKPNNGTSNATQPTATTKITTDACPVESNSPATLQIFDNKCYFFALERRMAFKKAESFCEEYGGNLAMPKTKEINNFLHYHLVYTHGLILHPGNLWIGLTFNTNQNAFQWLDGSIEKYSNFRHAVTSKDCVSITPKDGKWEDTACHQNHMNEKLGFICEFDTTDPSTQTQQTTISTSTIVTTHKTAAPSTTTTKSTQKTTPRPPSTTASTSTQSLKTTPTSSNNPCVLLSNCDLSCKMGFFYNTVTSCFECKCDE